MTTGETCLAAILRYELHQQAFGTGLRMLQVAEIETRRRIHENKIRTPWKALPFSLPTGIEEGEFGRQYLENIAPVRHRNIPGNDEPKGGKGRHQESAGSVMRITGGYHGVRYQGHISRCWHVEWLATEWHEVPVCGTHGRGDAARRDLHVSTLWAGDYRELPGVPAPGRAAVLQSAGGVSKGFVYNHFVGIVSEDAK